MSAVVSQENSPSVARDIVLFKLTDSVIGLGGEMHCLVISGSPKLAHGQQKCGSFLKGRGPLWLSRNLHAFLEYTSFFRIMGMKGNVMRGKAGTRVGLRHPILAYSKLIRLPES
jgi:hypothetical protein